MSCVRVPEELAGAYIRAQEQSFGEINLKDGDPVETYADVL